MVLLPHEWCPALMIINLSTFEICKELLTYTFSITSGSHPVSAYMCLSKLVLCEVEAMCPANSYCTKNSRSKSQCCEKGRLNTWLYWELLYSDMVLLFDVWLLSYHVLIYCLADQQSLEVKKDTSFRNITTIIWFLWLINHKTTLPLVGIYKATPEQLILLNSALTTNNSQWKTAVCH